ncbi:MAG: glycoside hydrolase family 2 protein, partial [Chloroflexi bacterium]|nr:glycoside hydrolase family 2 protein [Chloroflexota bacterium]
RVYAPVLASFKATAEGGMELWLTNDTLGPMRERATVRLATFGGRVLSEATREVEVPAGASEVAWRWAPDEVRGAPDRYLSVSAAEGRFPWNRHFFSALKDCQRTPTAPSFETRPVDRHTLRAVLSAPLDRYVYFANLVSPYETTRFSDNYVDLEPGTRRELTVHDAERELTPEALTLGWA